MTTFDAKRVFELGWRQGAVLGKELAGEACKQAPSSIPVTESDWLILTSHSCDVVAHSIDKEPVVELLRAQVLDRRKPDGQQILGRNPRSLQLAIEQEGDSLVLSCKVHERWTIPRELLLVEPPVQVLPKEMSRLISEWLAKRYIRAAFPSEFDRRWRGDGSRNLKTWIALLKDHSRWIQGVYIRLNTMNELDPGQPYRCYLLLAMPAKLRNEPEWETERQSIERKIDTFWSQFEPDIVCDGCEVLGTDELTLDDLARYHRFDADWVSFADDSDSTPAAADMST